MARPNLQVPAELSEREGTLAISVDKVHLSWTADDAADHRHNIRIPISDIQEVFRNKDAVKLRVDLRNVARAEKRPASYLFAFTTYPYRKLDMEVMRRALGKIRTPDARGIGDIEVDNAVLGVMQQVWARRTISEASAEGMEEQICDEIIGPVHEALQETLQWTLFPQPYRCDAEGHCGRCDSMWKPKNLQRSEHHAYSTALDDEAALSAFKDSYSGALDLVNKLREKLTHHADGILNAWKSAQPEERRELLVQSGPFNLPGKRWPEAEWLCRADSASDTSWLETRHSETNPWYLPYLTIDSLIHDPTVLLRMLYERTRRHVSEFVAGDLAEAKRAFDRGQIGVSYSPLCFVAYGPHFGEKVPWTPEAAHEGRVISFPEASHVLTAQSQLLRLLISVTDTMTSTTETGCDEFEREVKSGFQSLRTAEESVLQGGNDIPTQPRLSRLGRFPFEVYGQFEAEEFFEIAKERLAAAEDDLRTTQSEPLHVQNVVKELRRTNRYKKKVPEGVWRRLAYDLWMPLFRRAQLWKLIQTRAELVLRIFNMHRPDQDSGQPVVKLVLDACGGLDHTIFAQAPKLMFQSFVESMESSTVFDKTFIDRQLTEEGNQRVWQLSEFRDQPYAWAATKVGGLLANLESADWATACIAEPIISDHLWQNGSERWGRFSPQMSDVSALLYLGSMLRRNMPLCRPFTESDMEDTWKTLPDDWVFDSESMLNDQFQRLPAEKRKGFKSIDDLNPIRLGPAGDLLRDLCEKYKWPTSENENVASLVASTRARHQLLRFWEEMQAIFKADMESGNPDRNDEDIKDSWEFQMTCFYRSKDIHEEYSDELSRMNDMKQKALTDLNIKIIAERKRCTERGYRYNEEWKRKNDLYGGVNKGRKKKKTSKSKEDALPTLVPDPNGQIFIAFMQEFADFFDMGMPTTPTEERPPSPKRIELRRGNFKVITWLFPRESRNGKIPGKVTWSDFRAAMAAAGFSSETPDGSVWAFKGTDENGNHHRIVIHDPAHGTGVGIEPYILERLGKRLTRSFDWTYDTFRLRES